MGTLHYDTHTFAFEDRTLIHLQVVIGAKLQRQESFFLSWKKAPDNGSGHLSIWMQPSIPLLFDFSDDRDTTINTTWIRLMTESSNSRSGLRLTPEPAQPHTAPTKRTVS